MADEDGPTRLLRDLLRRRRGTAALAVLLALTAAGVSLAMPMIVGDLITSIGRGRRPVAQAAEVTGLVVVGAFASGWSSYLLGRVGELGIADLRRRMVLRLLRMPPAEVRARGTGDLVSRTTADAAQLRSVSDAAVTAMPVSALVVVVSLILMGWIDWVLLLIVIGTFTLAGVAVRAFLRGMRRGGAAQQRAVGALAERLSSVLAALPTIKAYRAEERVIGPTLDQVDAVARGAIAADRSQAFISPLMGLGQQVAIIGVLAASGARLASGELTPAHFVAFLMYLFQVVNPLMTVSAGFGRIQLGLSALGRIQEVLAAPVERPGPAERPALPEGAPAVQFRAVTAGYREADVLHGLELTVPPRGITALVGLSGAGKSTVLNLVERFVEPRAGTVALHGVDAADWPLVELRARIAYVDQSCTLLDGTIRQNATLGCRTPPDDARIFEALHEVGLAGLVADLPEGLETRVGGANDLSGGQRQRLALVRALLADADVLLLDEPSSQLDGPNEERLLRIMDRAARDRAVLVVAHRLSTIRDAAQIVFLDGGRAVDSGTHGELFERCEGYRALVRSQSGDADVSDLVVDTQAALAEAGSRDGELIRAPR